MRIVQLTTDAREHFKNYSNAQPYFGAAPEALLQGFARRSDVEVHVVSCIRRPMVSPEKLAANIWYHAVEVPKLGWLTTGYQGCIRAVRRKVREIQPDLVHGQGTEKDCAITAVFSGYPSVVTIHGNMAELARLFHARAGSHAWLTARLEDFALPRTLGVFCNSAYTEDLVRPRSRRVWRVANPIRLPVFERTLNDASRAKPVLINIGFICERKRQLELLAVAEKIYQQGIGVELRFVGQFAPGDEYAARFLERVKEAERAGYARYLGTRDTDKLLDEIDQSAGMVHFPSEESFGLVVVEALARNLKLFGAKVGGLLDICTDIPGVELLAPDDWSGLAASIARWVESGAGRLTGAAEMMRARFHPDVIAARHMEIYRAVLNNCS